MRVSILDIEFMDWVFVKRRSEGLATECKVAEGIADYLSIENGLITEYEMKKELHDLTLNEKKKVKKHKLYDAVDKLKTRIPNYYCFVFPESFLEELSVDELPFNKKYGIITYSPSFEFKYVRHPSRLHPRPNSGLRKEIYRRMVRLNQRMLESLKKETK